MEAAVRIHRYLELLADRLRDRLNALHVRIFERALLVRYDAKDRTLFAVVQQGVDWPGDQWLLLDKFPFLAEALATGRAVFVEEQPTRELMRAVLERRGLVDERFHVVERPSKCEPTEDAARAASFYSPAERKCAARSTIV